MNHVFRRLEGSIRPNIEVDQVVWAGRAVDQSSLLYLNRLRLLIPLPKESNRMLCHWGP